MEDVAEGVDAVICDVALKDMERAGKTEAEIDARKLFIVGSSMGGFTALLYALCVHELCPLGINGICDMLTRTLSKQAVSPGTTFRCSRNRRHQGNFQWHQATSTYGSLAFVPDDTGSASMSYLYSLCPYVHR